MILQMLNWRVELSQSLYLGFKGDNNANNLTLTTDFTDEYDLKLDVELAEQKNIIQLTKTADKTYSVLLTRDMLGTDGLYKAQIRGTMGDIVKHSNIFYLRIGDSINAADSFPPELPSEFEQMERRLTAINNNPPKASDTGYWLLYNPETGEYAQSDIPLPKGETGPAGADGKAATIKVGSVTEGETASVTNSGTENAAVFDFVIPKASGGGGGGTLMIKATFSEEPLPPETPVPPDSKRLDLDTPIEEIESAILAGSDAIVTLNEQGVDCYFRLIAIERAGMTFWGNIGSSQMEVIIIPKSGSGIDFAIRASLPVNS